MELRQIRYFVKVAELGSINKASVALDTVQSAVSHQMARLESDLGARLLRRTAYGVGLTEAGVAFLREARLILRHAEQARISAVQARLTGTASVGFAPSTARVLAVPFVERMREHFPEVRLHIVEGVTGQLETLLRSRRIDVAMLFNAGRHPDLQVTEVLQEKLFLVGRRGLLPEGGATSLQALSTMPLILNTVGNGLRDRLDVAFSEAGLRPNLVAEIDSSTIIMDAVCAGVGVTVQPKAVLLALRADADQLATLEIENFPVHLRTYLCSIAHGELSPAALATIATVKATLRHLVDSGGWPGALAAADYER